MSTTNFNLFSPVGLLVYIVLNSSISIYEKNHLFSVGRGREKVKVMRSWWKILNLHLLIFFINLIYCNCWLKCSVFPGILRSSLSQHFFVLEWKQCMVSKIYKIDLPSSSWDIANNAVCKRMYITIWTLSWLGDNQFSYYLKMCHSS